MTIIYSLIVREKKTVICEHTEYAGNFQQITRQLFPHIEKNGKKSFQTSEYIFHCIDDDGISFLCMTDDKHERKPAYAFLADLKKTFYNKFNMLEIQNAGSYELEFGEEMSK